MISAALLSCSVSSTSECPSHTIKVPRRDLEIQRIPPLVKRFILFANRNSSKNIQLLDKISYYVCGSLNSSSVRLGNCRYLVLAVNGSAKSTTCVFSSRIFSCCFSFSFAVAVTVAFAFAQISIYLFSPLSLYQVVLSRQQHAGRGALVRRSIGGFRLCNFDPFLLLDEVDMGPPAGSPDHPNRRARVTLRRFRVMENSEVGTLLAWVVVDRLHP